MDGYVPYLGMVRETERLFLLSLSSTHSQHAPPISFNRSPFALAVIWVRVRSVDLPASLWGTHILILTMHACSFPFLLLFHLSQQIINNPTIISFTRSLICTSIGPWSHPRVVAFIVHHRHRRHHTIVRTEPNRIYADSLPSPPLLSSRLASSSRSSLSLRIRNRIFSCSGFLFWVVHSSFFLFFLSRVSHCACIYCPSSFFSCVFIGES